MLFTKGINIIKYRIMIGLALSSLIFTSFGVSNVEASGTDVIYIVPATAGTQILPTTNISSSYISNNINVSLCPGQYKAASFVVRAQTTIQSLQVQSSSLTGTQGTLPASSVDIKVVKCWYQAGSDSVWIGGAANKQRILVPELLLKDDSLINVVGQDNYIKINGQYQLISQDAHAGDGIPNTPSIANFDATDSPTLLPVNITNGTNKQFWITINTPTTTAPGIYQGNIQLSIGGTNIDTIQLVVNVLPITLAKPDITYSIYYRGKLNTTGSISSEMKTQTQMVAELNDMLAHGITNPTVFQPSYDANLSTVLQLMKNAGMDTSILFFHGEESNLGYGATTDPTQLAALKQKVTALLALAASKGYSNVFIYGIDEGDGSSQSAVWQAIHQAGAKAFASGQKNVNINSVGNILDLMVCSYDLSAVEAAKWHSYGHKIFSYANPELGVENPLTMRTNYGLALWQNNYDGEMSFAYQATYGANIWNDFDCDLYRDLVMAYPTANGIIDTVEWEGFREGVDDIRYLTTLQHLVISKKASGIDVSAVETWLASLKSANLSSKNLDTVRSDMITQIINLQNQTSQSLNPDLNGDGHVNVLDQILICQTMGSTGAAGWISQDINKDGLINVLDLILVGQHYTG